LTFILGWQINTGHQFSNSDSKVPLPKPSVFDEGTPIRQQCISKDHQQKELIPRVASPKIKPIARAPQKSTPLDWTEQYIKRADHIGAIEYLEWHHPQLESLWHLKIFRLEQKKKAPFTAELPRWTQWAERHLSEWPQELEVILSITESHAKLGQLDAALRFHYFFTGQLLSPTDQHQASRARLSFISQHLKHLSSNEQWKEVLRAFEHPYFPHDETKSKLLPWKGKAHIALLQWEQANSTLDTIAGDPTLLNESNQLIAHIKKRRADLDKSHSEQRDWLEIPLKTYGDHSIISVELGDHHFDLLIDTGASMTTLSKTVLTQLEHHFNGPAQTKLFLTAAGWEEMLTSKLPYITLGPFRIADVQVAFGKEISLATHFDGLLGMNVLRFFRFEIDQAAGLLRLKLK
jgi:hypothetical protein